MMLRIAVYIKGYFKLGEQVTTFVQGHLAAASEGCCGVELFPCVSVGHVCSLAVVTCSL